MPKLPQVNLLPPEIRQARALQPFKRWFVISAVLALVVVAGAYVLGTIARSNAQAELDAANEETTRLLAEQQKYAEVPKVTSAIENALRARRAGMSTEVLWADYLSAIQAVIPEGVSIQTLTVDPVRPSAQDPLETPALARVTFTTLALTPPDVTEWMRNVDAIPGFSDARVTSVTVRGGTPEGDEDAPDEQYFEATTTALVTVDALSHRFDAEEADDAE